jgi:hypothetical protein
MRKAGNPIGYVLHATSIDRVCHKAQIHCVHTYNTYVFMLP